MNTAILAPAMAKPPQWQLAGLILYESDREMTLQEINSHPLMEKWYLSSNAQFPSQQTRRRLDMRVDLRFEHVTSTRENSHLIFGKTLESKFFLTMEGKKFIETSVFEEYQDSEWSTSTESSDSQLDLLLVGTSVWDIIQGNAEHYRREGLIFNSHRQDTPYKVVEVDFDGVTIGRLNGGDNVLISRKMFVDKAKLVEEGSPLPDKDISTTTAIKTAIVELHPYLSYQDDLLVRYRRRKTSSIAQIDTYLEKTESKEGFDISSIAEARERIVRAINVRRGQGKFRRELLNAYEGKCCITECDTKEVIEAAHIIPYRGEMTNNVRNGLILRADLHTLFDRCMIWIDTNTWSMMIDPELKTSQYSELAGIKIRLPADQQKWPSVDALNQHMDSCTPSFD